MTLFLLSQIRLIFFYCWLVLCCLISQYNISRNGWKKEELDMVLYASTNPMCVRVYFEVGE